MMDTKELIRQFCQKRQVTIPEPTSEGWFLLDFCDGDIVSCIPKGKELILATEITVLGKEELKAAHTTQRLLNYCFATIADQRGVLSLDRKSKALVLWFSFEVPGTSLSAFENLLENFLNHSNKLRRLAGTAEATVP